MNRFSVFCVGSLAALVHAGCIDVNFTTAVPLQEQRIESSSTTQLLGDVFPAGIPVTLNLEEEVETRDADGAEAVYLLELSFRITDTAEPPPDTDDFDFVDRITARIESSQPGTSLPAVPVATLDPVPTQAREIFLEPFDDVNLKPYIEEGARVTFEVMGTPPPDDVTFDGEATFRVELQ